MLKQQLWWHQQLCNTCIKHVHWKQNIWKLYYLILNSCLIWSWWASAHWIVLQRFVEFLICGVVPLLCGMFRQHVHLHPTYTLKNIELCVCVELFWKIFFILNTPQVQAHAANLWSPMFALLPWCCLWWYWILLLVMSYIIIKVKRN